MRKDQQLVQRWYCCMAWRWQFFSGVIPDLVDRWHLYALDFRGQGLLWLRVVTDSKITPTIQMPSCRNVLGNQHICLGFRWAEL
jgi:hypothetical protein